MNKKEKSVFAVITIGIIAVMAVIIAVSFLSKSNNNFTKEPSVANNSQSISQSISEPANTEKPAVSDESSTQAAASQSTRQNSDITVDEAKNIALKDSGQENNANIQFTSQKQDFDNGRYIYEIDFHDSATEYEYEIDCSSGEIISKSSEPFDYD